MIHYVIPARRNSKEFPFKNRKLIKDFNIELLKQCSVYSDDEYLEKFCLDNNVVFVSRPEEVSTDTCSTKKTISRYVKDNNLAYDDTVILLYLTYPERSDIEVRKALDFFIENKGKSLLCRKKCLKTPYLMAFTEEGNTGRQVIQHNLYRKQDYPEVFEISHYICIFKVSELSNLNDNLYNDKTLFYPISEVIDVDYERDYEHYKNNS